VEGGDSILTGGLFCLFLGIGEGGKKSDEKGGKDVPSHFLRRYSSKKVSTIHQLASFTGTVCRKEGENNLERKSSLRWSGKKGWWREKEGYVLAVGRFSKVRQSPKKKRGGGRSPVGKKEDFTCD